MRGKEFLDKMELLDPELVQAAAMEPEKPTRRQAVIRFFTGSPPAGEPQSAQEPGLFRRGGGVWAAAALCLCAALLPVLLTQGASLFGLAGASQSMAASQYAQYQDWQEGFAPEDYFKFNPESNQGLTGIYLAEGLNSGQLVYDGFLVLDPEDPDQLSFTRWLNNTRTVPVSPTQYLYCGATFQGDQATEVRYLWEDLDPNDEAYTWDTIYVTASTQKQPWDKFEGYAESSQSETVTRRDGVDIRAVGRPGYEKALWFQKDGAWYKVYGDPDVTAEALGRVVDWLWTGEAQPDRFDPAEGDRYAIENCQGDLAKLAEELPIGKYIPTDPRWCPELDGLCLTHVNDSPAAALAEYRPDPSKLLDVWQVYLPNDLHHAGEYVQERSLGQLEAITEEQVREHVAARGQEKSNLLAFQWGAYYVEAWYQNTANTAKDIWELLCYLRDEMGAPDGQLFKQSYGDGMNPEDLFQHEDKGISSNAVGDYFLPPENQPEENTVYFSTLADPLNSQPFPPLPADFFSCYGYFDSSSQPQKLLAIWYKEDPEAITGSSQSIFLGCGPGKQDFSALIEAGTQSGMTITGMDGTKVYALGGKYSAKLLAFQKEDSWYVLQGEPGARVEDMALIVSQLLSQSVDFSLFAREKGYTYSHLNLDETTDEPEAKKALENCPFVEQIPSWEEFLPEVRGMTLLQRKSPEGTEDVELSLSLAIREEPGKFIQGVDVFTSSDMRFLSAREKEALVDMSVYSALPSLDEQRRYIQDNCGLSIYRGGLLVLDFGGTYMRLSLNGEAEIDKVSDGTMENILTMLGAFNEAQTERLAQQRHETWRKALGALGFAQLPLEDLTLSNHPAGGKDPAFDLAALPTVTHQDIEAYLNGSPPTVEVDGETRKLLSFQWGESYASAIVRPGASVENIYTLLSRVRNMTSPESLGNVFTMGSASAMTVSPELAEALPDLFQHTTPLGAPVDWPIPVEDAVNAWARDTFEGFEWELKTIHVMDLSKDQDTMLASVSYLVKPNSAGSLQGTALNVTEAGEDGWYYVGWQMVLKKQSGGSWRVTETGGAMGIEDSLIHA